MNQADKELVELLKISAVAAIQMRFQAADAIERLSKENERLREALARALWLIDSPHFRDGAGLRPNAHQIADDIREMLAARAALNREET